MRLTILLRKDGTPLIAYLKVSEGKVEKTVPNDDETLNFDYGKDGLLVGIEVLHGIKLEKSG